MQNQELWLLVKELNLELTKAATDLWFRESLWSVGWWIELFSVIIFWTAWWRLVDKKRLLEITSYGLMVGLAATVLDLIGLSLGLWGYPVMLLPLVPPLMPANLAYLPVLYMLLYQYFTRLRQFSIAAAAMAFFMAFAGEPIMVRLLLYEINRWKHVYSFAGYFLLAVFLKWVIERVKRRQNT